MSAYILRYVEMKNEGIFKLTWIKTIWRSGYHLCLEKLCNFNGCLVPLGNVTMYVVGCYKARCGLLMRFHTLLCGCLTMRNPIVLRFMDLVNCYSVKNIETICMLMKWSR